MFIASRAWAWLGMNPTSPDPRDQAIAIAFLTGPLAAILVVIFICRRNRGLTCNCVKQAVLLSGFFC